MIFFIAMGGLFTLYAVSAASVQCRVRQPPKHASQSLHCLPLLRLHTIPKCPRLLCAYASPPPPPPSPSTFFMWLLWLLTFSLYPQHVSHLMHQDDLHPQTGLDVDWRHLSTPPASSAPPASATSGTSRHPVDLSRLATYSHCYTVTLPVTLRSICCSWWWFLRLLEGTR